MTTPPSNHHGITMWIAAVWTVNSHAAPRHAERGTILAFVLHAVVDPLLLWIARFHSFAHGEHLRLEVGD